jgi:thymidylate kinase
MMIEFFGMVEAAVYEADTWRHHAENSDRRTRGEPRRQSHSLIPPVARRLPAAMPSDQELPAPPARGRVVLIEGLDLAGKTTLVRNLEAELTQRGASVRINRNSMCPDNPIAPVADQLRRDPSAGLVESGAIFLASHLWDARHFQPPLPGAVHIQDSCWLRTLAYHSWKNTPAIPVQLAQAAKSFPRFDATIILTAGIEQRQRRLAQREREQPGSNDFGDHAVVHDVEGFQHHERILLDLAVTMAGARIIDTTNVGTRKVLEHVLTVLRFT